MKTTANARVCGPGRAGRVLLAVLGLLLGTSAFADSPAIPGPKTFVSESGKFQFKFTPADGRNFLGVAYEVQGPGKLRELWRLEKWYAFEAFISENGEYLVCMGDWAIGDKPSNHNLAVAFFKRGKLLASYSTADLVKDKTKVVVSTSHYQWLARDVAEYEASINPGAPAVPVPPLRLDGDHKFHLKTCDNIEYTFDAATGKILETKTPAQVSPEKRNGPETAPAR